MSTHDLKTAIRLHRNGRLQAAHDSYEQLIKKWPDDARLRSLFGQLKLQMGLSESALAELRQAAELDPQDKRIALTLARGLAAGQRVDEALNIVHRVLADDDSSAGAWATLAAVHRNRDDHVNELVALERASELASDDVSILIARSNAEAANSFTERAIETLQEATRLSPRNPRLLNNLGALYLRRNNLDAALAVLQQAIEITPDYATALSNLAIVQHRLGKLDAARSSAERALKSAPDNIDARCELATILMAQGDLAGADAGFSAALRLASSHPGVLAGMAELRDRQGRADEGLEMIAKVIASGQGSHDLRLTGAGLAKRLGRRETALQLLRPLLDSDGDAVESLDRTTRRRVGFLLGDIHDAGSDYRVALKNYDMANAVLRPEYDADRLYEYVDSIVAAFNESPSDGDKSSGHSPRRLFLIGMPRSGSSLLNAMLAQHPQVRSCGELPVARQLLESSGIFPNKIMELSQPELNRLGDRYCAEVAAPPDTRWMVDNTPLNFFYLGGIAKMLPDAIFVHCRRYPADCLLSCYFHNFLDPALGFSFDVENLQHYWMNYSRLMRHWGTHWADRIVDVQYEELVATPEAVMSDLLERLELQWSDDILHPENTGRYVSSDPHAQAWQSIHSRSVGRFARYRPFLGDRAASIENLA
ncbi:MAG: tetratricopeptide repeat protein [Gammaproteobacteria bacterium]|nr:tetratricopeptide repeat protein [Gammaproteobacteria bacterium]